MQTSLLRTSSLGAHGGVGGAALHGAGLLPTVVVVLSSMAPASMPTVVVLLPPSTQGRL